MNKIDEWSYVCLQGEALFLRSTISSKSKIMTAVQLAQNASYYSNERQ